MLRLAKIWDFLKLWIKGSFVYPLTKHTEKELARRQDLFLMLCFGDMLGLPIPTYITLKLLPYFIAEMPYWRRRMSRGRISFFEKMAEFSREF